MAAKSCEILYKTYDLFRRSLWRKSLLNSNFTTNSSTLNALARTAMKENQLKSEINTIFADNLTIPSLSFVNRNPKNPEYFGYNKQRGYSTQYKKRNFFRR